MAHQLSPWEWFTEKVLPGLFLSVAIGVVGTSFAVWQTVAQLTNAIQDHERRLIALEVDSKEFIKRTEMLETLKRVEQQLQIVLLQSGLKTKIEIK